MRRRFAVKFAEPWRDWDPLWLREISAHARWIAVRFTGLAIHDRAAGVYKPNEQAVLSWQGAMRRIIRQDKTQKPRVAYAIVQFRSYASGRNPLRQSYQFHHNLSMYLRWGQTLRLRHRIEYMLKMLRAETHLPILVHVEDFSARWVLASGFRPDIWVMDNPIVAFDEMEDLWAEQLSRPGFVRHSRWSRFRWWDWWRMHIRQDELIASRLPIQGFHGYWRQEINQGRLPPVTSLLR